MRTSGSLHTLAWSAVLVLGVVGCGREESRGAAPLQGAAEREVEVADLDFREFFAMPVGARGLEPTARLIALDGKRVRLRGYMAREESPLPGRFMLSPLPVEMGEADESLANDLPPALAFVHAGPASDPALVRFAPGIVEVVGVLEIGARDEADGQVSQVRLTLEARSAGFTQDASR